MFSLKSLLAKLTTERPSAAQLVVAIDGSPSLFPPAEPAAASRICMASRHLHRHYRMRRKRRAARRRPPSGGPQFNVKTLGGLDSQVPRPKCRPAIHVGP